MVWPGKRSESLPQQIRKLKGQGHHVLMFLQKASDICWIFFHSLPNFLSTQNGGSWEICPVPPLQEVWPTILPPFSLKSPYLGSPTTFPGMSGPLQSSCALNCYLIQKVKTARAIAIMACSVFCLNANTAPSYINYSSVFLISSQRKHQACMHKDRFQAHAGFPSASEIR